MNQSNNIINPEVCQRARLTRDARFDGVFFTAVKTTGIYCRSICPATPPKESNVSYFNSAVAAASAGYRPCLRCRPDSAPHSAAWMGNQAVLQRAMKLIEQGALEQQSLLDFSNYLGISDRYLRMLFEKHLGVAPKQYALYQQCLFAKKLIHETQLPMNQIALTSGFNSVRRFNDCFVKTMKMTPTEIRRKSSHPETHKIKLKLHYRPPYDWPSMQQFYAKRYLPGIETVDADSYGRSFTYESKQGSIEFGSFMARHDAQKHAFDVEIKISNLNQLKAIVQNIRRLLDLDADSSLIEAQLKIALPEGFELKAGLRLPGIWHVFEAGVRAILGQQVSVTAARNLCIQLIENLGQKHNGDLYFPSAKELFNSDLSFFKMPASRKASLKNLAQLFMQNHNAEPDSWLTLKGIGPWTVNYAKLRGLSDPDVFLAGDSGINKAILQYKDPNDSFNPESVSPWRSYLTFQLWNQL